MSNSFIYSMSDVITSNCVTGQNTLWITLSATRKNSNAIVLKVFIDFTFKAETLFKSQTFRKKIVLTFCP